MKAKRILSAFVAIVTAMSCLTFASFTVSAQQGSTYYKKADFENGIYLNGAFVKVYSELASSAAATLTEKAAMPDGTNGLKITPKSAKYSIGLRQSTVTQLAAPLSDVDYVRYRYYYGGESFEGQRAKIVLKASDFNLSKDCTVYSLEPVVSGEWAYLNFAIQDEIWGYILSGGTLPEIVFYPFADALASNLKSTDVFYLDEFELMGKNNSNAIAAMSQGTLTHKYPVYFEPGRADVGGEKPETIYAELGQTITLPENTFTREGYSFMGWVCSDGSVLMQPGDEYTLTSKTILGGVQYNSARTFFVAEWTSPKQESNLPSVNIVDYSEYFCGITNYHDYATYQKNVEFDGRNTVKVDFHPTASSASTQTINLDAWIWTGMPLDFSKYKYMIMLYYYKTDGTTGNFRPYVNFLGSSGDTNALSKTVKSTAKNYISKNKWDIMCFEFDIMNKYPSYIKSESDTVIRQTHFFPFGNTKASKLSEGDSLYVASCIFLDEIPSETPVYNNGYISGYEDGTFRPNNNVTNAEAASFITKALGVSDAVLENYTESSYSDIDSDDYYFGSVAYLESIGALNPQDGDKFNPSAYADRSEFVQSLVRLKSGGAVADGLNVSDIPSASAVAFTRAQAINSINTIYGGKTYSSAEALVMGESPFSDVTAQQWYYADVILGASDAVTYKRQDGSAAMTSVVPGESKEEQLEITDEQYQAGIDYVKQLDTLTNTRIEEIRNTESVYKAAPGGTVYYVSSSEGSTSNAGTSENTPKRIYTLDEVSEFSFLKPGDVVLFKRGDTFRGYMTAKAGVTYSAYGEGDKPLFTRSPENGSGSSKWKLFSEDKTTGAKIWKYYNENYVDVGGIALIDSSGNHFMAYKNIPDYQKDETDITGDADYVPGEENFWIRGKMGYDRFKVLEQLDHNYEYVHLAQYAAGSGNSAVYGEYDISNGCPSDNAVGPLYLRCDEGNPGELYPRIEFNLKKTVIAASGNGVTIDNICIKYFGSHGVGSGKNNLTVRNCEIGWGGGAIQHYNTGKENAGRVTRFGNGIEIYGGLVNYLIDNCYVYEIYDAGITHQISSTSDGNYYMEGVYYTNNVLTHSTYNIEYFMSKNAVEASDGTIPKRERFMKDVYFTDNIVRYAGYGWGVQRPDSAPSNIKGWTHHNFATNYVIEDNIFDRCIDLRAFSTDYNIQVGTSYESSTPYLKNNIFVQVPGRDLMTFGKVLYRCDSESEQLLNTVGGIGNKLYFYPDDTQNYTHHVFW